MRALLDVILVVLHLYTYVIIAAAVLSWLFAFGVVNPRNGVVNAVSDVLHRLTEPLLRPLRNLLPNLGGLDLSPVVLLLGLFFLERVILIYIYPNVF